jgi:hypothetical protein
MEWLFFLIIVGLFCFFIGYAIKFHHKDKKVLDEYKEKKSHELSAQEIKNEIPDQTAGRVLGWRDLSEEEMCVFYSELPSLDCYKSLN